MPKTLEQIAEALREIRADLEFDNYIAEQRERMRDKYDNHEKHFTWQDIAEDDSGMSAGDFK